MRPLLAYQASNASMRVETMSVLFIPIYPMLRAEPRTVITVIRNCLPNKLMMNE